MSKLGLINEDSAPGLSSLVLFDYPNVHFDDEREVVVMLSLTAPEMDVSKARPPLNIVAAIDCSTSMAGTKMNNAKASLRKLVDHLGPNDRLSVIGFHSSVFEVFPSALMDGISKATAHKKIGDLKPNGWTNFSGALLQAFSEIKKVEGKKGSVNRIILFTDGAPSAGVQDPAELLSMLEKSMVPEISLTTFGYGEDVETELLSEMAKRGKGNFFFVKDIEKCAEMFGLELGGLLSTYAQNVKVTYTLADGVSLVKVLDTAYGVDGNALTISDVLGGETKNLLMRVKLPKKTKAVTARPCKVVEFAIEYDHVSEARHRKFSDDGAVNYVRQKDAVSTEATQEVQAQVDLLAAASAMTEARVLADAGNLSGAKHVLDSLRGVLSERNHAFALNLDADLGDLSRGMESAAAYVSTRGDLIGTSHGYSTRRVGGSSRSAMFSTTGQSAMSESFVGNSGSIVVPTAADPAPGSSGDELSRMWSADPSIGAPTPPARPDAPVDRVNPRRPTR